MNRPILIIEDDADIAELEVQLRARGTRAVIAPTEAGLTAALNEREPPRLIVLD